MSRSHSIARPSCNLAAVGTDLAVRVHEHLNQNVYDASLEGQGNARAVAVVINECDQQVCLCRELTLEWTPAFDALDEHRRVDLPVRRKQPKYRISIPPSIRDVKRQYPITQRKFHERGGLEIHVVFHVTRR